MNVEGLVPLNCGEKRAAIRLGAGGTDAYHEEEDAAQAAQEDGSRRRAAVSLAHWAHLCADLRRGPAGALVSVGDGPRDRRADRARVSPGPADRDRVDGACVDRLLPPDVRHAR